MATTSATRRADAPPRSTLPGAIRGPLARVAWRLKGAAALGGSGAALAVLACGAAAGMAADFAWEMPQGARWAIWLGGVGLAAAMFAGRAAGPWARGTSWLDLAALAERAEPALGERLTATVALLSGPARPHGSPALIAAVADDAAARLGGLDLNRAVPTRPAWRSLAVGLAMLGIVVAPAVARPDPFARMLARAVAPWSGAERVGRFVVEVEPGDRVAAMGSEVPVSRGSWRGSRATGSPATP